MLDTTEKLPLLRFVKTAEEDRIASEQAGKTQYMDVVKVYIRAAGDMKTEVVDVAEKRSYEVSEATVKVEKPHVVLREVDGEMQETEEKAVVDEVRRYYTPKVVNPWIKKQKERLHHGKITQKYFDYCMDAFERFKRDEDQPIDGTPLDMWKGAPESVKKRAIECGIRSVEAAAEMTTEALSAIGMGASDLKKRAIAFLETDTAPVEAAQKMARLDEENTELKEQMSALEAKLEELAAAPKKGRPKKQADAA